MNNLVNLEKVRRLEAAIALEPQVEFDTHHVIHGGMYARTVKIPAGVTFTGALIKIPTIVIVEGDVTIWIGNDSAVRFKGYNVLAGTTGRKNAFVTHSDVTMTMLFPTKAMSVEECEMEFTDEFDLLASHRDDSSNYVLITGE